MRTNPDGTTCVLLGAEIKPCSGSETARVIIVQVRFDRHAVECETASLKVVEPGLPASKPDSPTSIKRPPTKRTLLE